jgi:hypothetical protein
VRYFEVAATSTSASPIFSDSPRRGDHSDGFGQARKRGCAALTVTVPLSVAGQGVGTKGVPARILTARGASNKGLAGSVNPLVFYGTSFWHNFIALTPMPLISV